MVFLVSGRHTDQSAPKRRRNTRAQQGSKKIPPFPTAQTAVNRKPTAPSAAPAVSAVPTRLIPLTDWSQHHAWPPIGGLRHLVFFEKTNGFHKVVRRAGRRVLIDETAFFAWVDSNGGNHAAS